MSRELKFRVWTPAYKKYYTLPEEFLGFKLDEDEKAMLAPVFRCDVIEQCTGLKDKNGKEIYEGDIIRIDSFFDYETISDYEVAWDEDFLCYQLKCIKGVNYDNDLGDISESACEIIGNIHEKSESLKERK